ncbi:hypothetical protein I4U23_027066 [Adineta vaga]|nr:hypothetical protein I4U23_027066 [Adineta vaga]
MENFIDKSVQTTEEKPSNWKKWFGFTNFTVKGALDKMAILITPTIIGVLTVLIMQNTVNINKQNRENDLERDQLRRVSDEQLNFLQANETVLNQYVSNMANIVLEMRREAQTVSHLKIIRSLAFGALRRLDSKRKKFVIQHLYDMALIKDGETIFYSINSGIGRPMHLKGAVLDGADFSGEMSLPLIFLRNASLVNVSFVNADLQNADFTGSILIGANFSYANLDGANFVDTQLQEADFTGASVRSIQFFQVNLTRSSISNEQISQAAVFYNTVLPNGTYARNKTYWLIDNERIGWNITSGNIEMINSSFTATSNASILRRIDAKNIINILLYYEFNYCLSLQFTGNINIQVNINFTDYQLFSNRFETITKDETQFATVKDIQFDILGSISDAL